MSESGNGKETARDDHPGDGGTPTVGRQAGQPAPPPADAGPVVDAPEQLPGEVRGPKGPEPTRFGDWEKAGRCYDF